MIVAGQFMSAVARFRASCNLWLASSISYPSRWLRLEPCGWWAITRRARLRKSFYHIVRFAPSIIKQKCLHRSDYLHPAEFFLDRIEATGSPKADRAMAAEPARQEAIAGFQNLATFAC
jgi:hypothetical protein